MINFNKSKLFFLSNIIEELQYIYIDALNMRTTSAIETYFGLSVMGVKVRKFCLDH